MTTDAAGTLYVIDGDNVLKLGQDGATRTVVATYAAGPAAYRPVALSTDSTGRLYVLLQYRNTYNVEQIAADGTRRVVYRMSTYGTVIDFASNAQGDLAIAIDTPDDRDELRLVPQSAQPGEEKSTGVASRSLAIGDSARLAFDTAGNLYLADAKTAFTGNSGNPAYTISDMRIRRIAPDGTTTTVLNGFADGTSTRTTINASSLTMGLAAGANGDLFVTDPVKAAIYKLTPSGTATLYAGTPGETGSSD